MSANEFEKKKIDRIFVVLRMCKLDARRGETVRSLNQYWIERGTLTVAQKDLLYSIYERS